MPEKSALPRLWQSHIPHCQDANTHSTANTGAGVCGKKKGGTDQYRENDEKEMEAELCGRCGWSRISNWKECQHADKKKNTGGIAGKK